MQPPFRNVQNISRFDDNLMPVHVCELRILQKINTFRVDGGQTGKIGEVVDVHVRSVSPRGCVHHFDAYGKRRVKIYGEIGPGLSTGGEDLFSKKIRG